MKMRSDDDGKWLYHNLCKCMATWSSLITVVSRSASVCVALKFQILDIIIIQLLFNYSNWYLDENVAKKTRGVIHLVEVF